LWSSRPSCAHASRRLRDRRHLSKRLNTRPHQLCRHHRLRTDNRPRLKNRYPGTRRPNHRYHQRPGSHVLPINWQDWWQNCHFGPHRKRCTRRETTKPRASHSLPAPRRCKMLQPRQCSLPMPSTILPRRLNGSSKQCCAAHRDPNPDAEPRSGLTPSPQSNPTGDRKLPSN